MSPEGYLRANGEDFKTKIIYDAYKEYQKVLKKNNAMDFDDLILNVVKLFEKDEEVLLKYQNRFRYVMVDEYQDTNFIQYKFIKMIAEAHNNICVVGDDDQCIYQWRGADIRNILDFEKDFKNTKVIKLERNYRSNANIINAAHSVIEKNRQRKNKKLWTDKEDGDKIKYYRADDEKEEARFIAQEIDILHSAYKHEHDQKLEYSDFAILYRTNAQSRVFEEALSRRDVPYRVLGGLRYYDRKEIKDIVAYMRLVQNPADDLSLARIINEPKRGIGDKTLDKIKALALTRNESLLTCLSDDTVVEGLPSKAVDSVKEMVAVILGYGQEKENLKVSDIYDGLLKRTGYLSSLEGQNTVEAESRIENLLEFKSVIYDYEKETPELSLAEFMEKIALMSEIDNHDESENAIVLMTMHSAKGLEFPVVFMPGMEDGLFPGWRSLEKEGGVEEERRLCYVGMTRAKQKLYMTSAAMRTMYGRTDYTRESQFMREVDKKLLDGDAIYENKKISNSGFDSDFGGSGRRGDGYSNTVPYRPFDSLKYAKQEIKNKATGAGKTFASGDRVKHTKFGEGMVIEADPKTVSIMFDEIGLKKLAKDIAPIEKL